MASKIEEIEREIRLLSYDERTHLLRDLVADLDGYPEPEVEKAWLEEAHQRLRELQQGKVEALSAKEVFKSTRDRLRDGG